MEKNAKSVRDLLQSSDGVQERECVLRKPKFVKRAQN